MRGSIKQGTAVWLALMGTSALATVRYVDVNSAAPAPPYSTWASAATTIQDAVDVALAGDEIVVTNGVYQTGGRAVDGAMTNRVAMTNALTVRSVNGPGVTVIAGTRPADSAVRCVYLGDGSTLAGFTLTNGATRSSGDYEREQSGGGVWCASATAVVSNCVLSGNWAFSSGGGASGGTLNYCTLTGNSAGGDEGAGGGASVCTLNYCTLSSNTVHGGIESCPVGGGALDCTLNNCTLTGNSAPAGGGAYGGTLNHCTLTGNSATAGDGGGGVYWGTLNNCTLTGNYATQGGGTYFGTLTNCTLAGNSAANGGGAYESTLNNCALTGNSAEAGGGASECSLNNCTLTGNSALGGGGAFGGTMNNCALTGNSAQNGGGYFISPTNCTLAGNSASDSGGGTCPGTLNNCTLSGNSASDSGGGAYGAMLNNCIVYYNVARQSGANYDSFSTLNYSCTTPLPPGGVGNLTAEPQLASASHLSAGSPCRAAGSAAYSSGLDIDGELWLNPPSIGCDEYHAGAITGPLSAAIEASYTNVATGFAVDFRAQIGGHASASLWEFGDGTVLSNRPYSSHSWTAVGDYTVVLRAYNESYPGGVSATVTVHVVEQPVHYVALESGNPLAPYTSWATAATSIQDAVDAATMVGALVLVSNGVYQTGGRVVDGATTNRVAVTKLLTMRSVNGAEVTVIDGGRAVRCAYLGDGAALVGFTLTNGTANNGGGVWCPSAGAVVSNCVLSGNSAGCGGGASGGTLNNCTLTGNSAEDGGGASLCTLNNCTLIGNWADGGGGGAAGGTLNNCRVTGNLATGSDGTGGGAALNTLNNCTLTGNSADVDGGGAYMSALNNCTLSGNSAGSAGGGAYFSTLNNCIVYYNVAVQSGGGANYWAGTFNYSCTTPLPGGLANFDKPPLFVDPVSGNLRLQSNSPCINAGLNAHAPAGLDLDGHSRIVGGTVDIGAYEFQSPTSIISYAWLQGHNLPTDGSADYADPDGDGLNNWQEWRAGTDPTDPLSVLRLMTPVPGPSGLTVSWQSVDTRTYFLERSTNLIVAPAFLPFSSNIVGQVGTTTLLDTNAAGIAPVFYRVGVQD